MKKINLLKLVAEIKPRLPPRIDLTVDHACSFEMWKVIHLQAGFSYVDLVFEFPWVRKITITKKHFQKEGCDVLT